jgi:hypothetical protein
VEECGMAIREVHVNEWCSEGDKWKKGIIITKGS